MNLFGFRQKNQQAARSGRSNRRFALVCTVMLSVLGAAYLAINETVLAEKNEARVVRLVGKARARAEGDNKWRALKVGHAVRDGDRVETGPNSHMILRYNQVEIRLGPNTKSRIDALLDAARPSRVHVQEGYSWFHIKKNKGPVRFQVSTPTAIASVRGTKFSVVEDAKGTVSCVCEGKVATSARDDEKDPAAVETGGSHSYSKDGKLNEKDFTEYFRGLKVDRSFQKRIAADERLNYCTSCHKMTDLATDNSPDPDVY